MLKLSKFDQNAINHNLGMNSWINTLFHHCKIPTSVDLGFLTDKAYSFNDVQGPRPLSQWLHAIIQYGIGCNIVDIANQLFFAYQKLAPELRVFISPSTKSTKAADFIYTLKEKQEIWYKVMTTLATP